MAQAGFRHAPRGPGTAPKRLQVAKEPPKEAPERPKSFKNFELWKINVLLPSRLFASDGLLRPQEGSKMAQEGGPKRGPRLPQDGPKSAQERPKSAPSGSFEGFDGGTLKESTPFLIDGLQDGPKKASKAPRAGCRAAGSLCPSC